MIDAEDLIFARITQKLGIQPQSIRARLCRTGSYFGVRPTKAPNGRLLWPPNAYEMIVWTASVIADAGASAPPPGNQDVDVIEPRIVEQLHQHGLDTREGARRHRGRGHHT